MRCRLTTAVLVGALTGASACLPIHRLYLSRTSGQRSVLAATEPVAAQAVVAAFKELGAALEPDPDAPHVYRTRVGPKTGELDTQLAWWAVEFEPLTDTATAFDIRQLTPAATRVAFGVDGEMNGQVAEPVIARVVEILGRVPQPDDTGAEGSVTELELPDSSLVAADFHPLSVETASACGIEWSDDVKAFLRDGHVVMLPDLTGDTAGPAAFERLVCATLGLGLRVTVVLSVDAPEQRRLDAYLASSGDAEARARLLSGKFWGREWQDGRSSVAMLQLLEQLRVRRQWGQPVNVVAGDIGLPGNPRTTFIASKVLERLRQSPRDLVLTFFANSLGRDGVGTEWDPTFETVAHRLRNAGVPTQSYDVAFNEGSKWACQLYQQGHLRCGTWPALPSQAQMLHGIEKVLRNQPGDLHLFANPRDGYDGQFFIGTPTASPPARPGGWVDEGQPAPAQKKP